MKLSTREDIEAPIDYVFGRATDFASFERSALRRGVEVHRLDVGQDVGKGASWRVEFVFRGRPRKAEAVIADFDPPNGFAAKFESGGLQGQTVVELVPLSPGRTRLTLSVEMTPKTLAARLLIQSLKLAKTNLHRKFKTRVADFAEDVEEDYSARS
ncbi:SRPBCC family protein [Loktanella sp. IMCC34160]|uniref:SRPBCC family protein n=1 Tax=Loktanella sp. IMCC34160 TaxID=2510646 RepID=UPI00101DA3CF|nr:SRPBCC family protein [Loktanella sp. IMCC34160]RYG91565.1 SRPBCC family protein [Loktanella sp. IMCC34160]